jgi:hypothetical protein
MYVCKRLFDKKWVGHSNKHLRLELFTSRISDQYSHSSQPTKCTISYTYKNTDISSTCFGMNMPSSGSICAKLS